MLHERVTTGVEGVETVGAVVTVVVAAAADNEPGGPSSALMVAELSLSMLRRLPWEADKVLLEAREPGGGKPRELDKVASASLSWMECPLWLASPV